MPRIPFQLPTTNGLWPAIDERLEDPLSLEKWIRAAQRPRAPMKRYIPRTGRDPRAVFSMLDRGVPGLSDMLIRPTEWWRYQERMR